MPTKREKNFSIEEISAPMDSNIQDKLDTILTRMGRWINFCKSIEIRLTPIAGN